MEGGLPGLLDRLATSADYERIAAETEAGMSNTWDDIMICEVEEPDRVVNDRAAAQDGGAAIVGKSVARIAADRDRQPVRMALDLLREYDGEVRIISFNNNEENLMVRSGLARVRRRAKSNAARSPSRWSARSRSCSIRRIWSSE